MKQDRNGNLCLEDPETMNPNDKTLYWPDYTFRSRFAHLKDLKMDSYNGELSLSDLQKCTCDICGIQFQNQTFMMKHRRALHFRKRKQSNNNINYDINNFNWNECFDTKGMLRVISSKKPDKYLCVFEDGHIEWLALPQSFKKVQEYLEYCALNPMSNDILTDYEHYDESLIGEWCVYDKN